MSDDATTNDTDSATEESAPEKGNFLTEGMRPESSTDNAEDALAAFRGAEPSEPVATEEAAAEPEVSAEDLLGTMEPQVEEVVRIAEPEPEPEPEVSAAQAVIEYEDDEWEDEVPLLVPVPDDGIARRWYAVHVHSGQEATVQKSLVAQAEQEGLSERLVNVLVPMERVAEFKSGEKKVSQRKFFPGYILVQLPEHPERDADLWHLIKDTSGVTGFIGSRNEPVPLEDSEVADLLEEIRGERERPRAKVNFTVGERVKINDGAFANFTGNVSEINAERGKLKVLIEIFERQTAVEVEFWQVEKL